MVMTGAPPPADDSGPHQGIAQDIARVTSAVAEAQRQAETGVPIDLSGLEERVSALCAAAMSRPMAEIRPHLGRLGDLVAALDPLAATLTAQHILRRDMIADALDGRGDPHSARHRAAAAYGRGPTPQPPEPSVPSAHPPTPDEPT
ncbi:hypothetical protein D3877_19400 [Azospirillum cavernae]|uniref:Uncharacterized protein n=2 Tax=Azospirillum cavernae TaxID=2320860 RepID=A0A418VYJ1_9PROT|nr:hypothetical protein D3877_19400 [Azospirillum cavernae]